MKVTAGVILIIAAVLNIFASLGYLTAGAATTSMSSGMKDAVAASKAPDANKVQNDIASGMAKSGGIALLAGIVILIAGGLMIAGAVMCFMDKNAGIILAAAILAIVAELLGIYMTSFGVMNILGLVAGVFAFMAYSSIKNSQATPA